MYRIHRTAGLALVALVLLIASVFVLMTAGAGDSVLMGEKQASRAQYFRRTNYAAYGCMQMALDKLTTNLLYSIDPAEEGTVENDPELTYQLSIYNNYLGNYTNPAPDGRWVPKYMVYIKTKVDFRAYPGKYTSTLFSKGYVGGQASDYAILGTKSVTLHNSLVDSWWVKELGTHGNKYLIPSMGGRITTNSIDASALTFSGNSSVNANLKWGPAGDEATVLNITDTAVWNTTLTKGPSLNPQRVPRFHPPRDPKFANADILCTSTMSLPPGDYKSLSVLNGTLTLQLPSTLPSPPNENKYYVANNVTIINSSVTLSGARGDIPCDMYVGKGFNAVNSTINWDNIPSPNLPPLKPNSPAPPGALVASQELLGPRTMRVLFVGSGAPKFKDCNFHSDNSKMSLHASGKAMNVLIENNSVIWGGFKGFQLTMKDSTLHFHRIFTE